MKFKNIRKVLFICVANSARSQIAEGIAKIVLPANLKIKSAGSKPADSIHPLAIQVLNEYGVDSSSLMPKAIADLPLGFLDKECLVIRLCTEEQCPLIDNVHSILDWSMPDPATKENKPRGFEEVARSITERLIELKNNL